MKHHYVKHKTIPISAFKPDKADGCRHKILRRFDDEYSIDYLLIVGDERDGKFILWERSPVRSIPNENLVTAMHGLDSLDQTEIDKIEAVPETNFEEDYDFAIFLNSPLAQESFRSKGH